MSPTLLHRLKTPPSSAAENRPALSDSELQDVTSQITLRLGRREASLRSAQAERRRQIFQRVLAALAWLYLMSLVLVWLLLWLAADRWWFATMMAFGPRWIYSLPLVALLPACLIWDRRRWRVLLAANLVLWFAVMDFRCPWGRISSPSGTTYRVLTCNLHYGEGDLVALRALIRRENPDFIALQEFSPHLIQSAVEGYHVIQSGRSLVASRFPLHEEPAVAGLELLDADLQSRVLFCSAETPQGKLYLGSLHLSSPRYGLSNVLDRTTGIQPSKKALLENHIDVRREESEAIAAAVKKLPGPIILAGDFNTPVESSIYGICWSSYYNAFSRTGVGFGRTFHADVHGIPFGVRIDHILGDARIIPVRCWLGPEIGSQHLPLLAEMVRQ